MTMHFPRESAKVHPPSLFPYYTSTVKRAPKRPLIILPHTETELTGPAYGHEVVQPGDERRDARLCTGAMIRIRDSNRWPEADDQPHDLRGKLNSRDEVRPTLKVSAIAPHMPPKR